MKEKKKTSAFSVLIADFVCCNRSAGTDAVCVPLENYQRGN